MSFGDNHFNRFKTTFNPESKLSEFRKRFEDFTQKPNNNNMLFNSKQLNGWPIGRNDIFSMAKNENNESEGIPIKVIHENSDEKPFNSNEERDESNCDANSCSGSSSSLSHKSSAHKSTNSGNSCKSNASVFSNEGSVEPRIHHIPIHVEPRDGSTSSGYTSEPNPSLDSNVSSHVIHNENPLSRSSSASSRHSVQSGGSRTSAFARSPSPAKSVSSNHSNNSSNSTNGPKPRVCQIPIQIETTVSPKSRSPLSTENVPNVKSNGLGQSTQKPIKTKSGPFVTRIPVVNESDVSPQEIPIESQSPLKEPKVKLNALEIIDKVLNDLQKYEIEVTEFDGKCDKKYRYLDEMLTRCMIKLDTIETEGKEDVRKARKAAVIAVNKCIALLESKLKNNTNNDTNETSTVEPMVVSTPEPSNDTNNKSEETEKMQIEQKVDKSEEKVEHNKKSANAENNEVKNGGNGGQRKETAV